jgi:hypothetical protein
VIELARAAMHVDLQIERNRIMIHIVQVGREPRPNALRVNPDRKISRRAQGHRIRDGENGMLKRRHGAGSGLRREDDGVIRRVSLRKGLQGIELGGPHEPGFDLPIPDVRESA